MFALLFFAVALAARWQRPVASGVALMDMPSSNIILIGVLKH
jgi:hypothetical protein